MTLDLEAIRKRADAVYECPYTDGDGDNGVSAECYEVLGHDIPALLAELERLRAEVAQQAPEQSTGVKAAQINVAPEVGEPTGAVERAREIEDFRRHLEEVGRPVQIATRAVVNRAREVAATAHQMHDAGPKDGPVMRLLAAVRELERHEDALRGRAPYGEHLRCEDHPGRPMGHDGCEGAGEVTELNNAIPNLQGPHADGCSWMGRNVCDCGYAPAFTGEEMNDSAQPQGSTPAVVEKVVGCVEFMEASAERQREKAREQEYEERDKHNYAAELLESHARALRSALATPSAPAVAAGPEADDEAYTDDSAIEDVQRVRDWMEGQDYMAVERCILDRVLLHLRGYSGEVRRA